MQEVKVELEKSENVSENESNEEENESKTHVDESQCK